MKIYLLTAVLFLSALNLQAQSMPFHDMTWLTPLSNESMYSAISATERFKLTGMEDVNGQTLSHFQSVDKNRKPIPGETLTTGAFRTTANAVKLHTFLYATIYPDYVYNLMAQMKKDGYSLTFKGSDPSKHIYIYDNSYNHVSVFIPFDHGTSTVEIRQKEMDIRL